MSKVRFSFDGSIKDNLTWDDLEILESGKIGASKNILARFVVDEAGKAVPLDEAKKRLGQLKMSEVEEVLKAFLELMTNSALNPTTAAA